MDHSGHGMNMDLPPFTLGRGLELSVDPFFLTGCVLALALYGYGVVRLRRRGDGWPVNRIVFFVVGVLSIALVMCTKLNDYGMVMFSVHMVQHMVISMLSPILLLLGAPVTLALRALPRRAGGGPGPRAAAQAAAQPVRHRLLLPQRGADPVDRSGKDAGQAAIREGLGVLAKGELLGIYPEGTRSHDGRPRARSGWRSWRPGVPVIPCAMLGTFEIQPPGQKIPKIKQVAIRFGGRWTSPGTRAWDQKGSGR
ncbi:hypothetical protein SCALM49S_04219 [Streptomyces californicus]